MTNRVFLAAGFAVVGLVFTNFAQANCVVLNHTNTDFRVTVYKNNRTLSTKKLILNGTITVPTGQVTLTAVGPRDYGQTFSGECPASGLALLVTGGLLSDPYKIERLVDVQRRTFLLSSAKQQKMY